MLSFAMEGKTPIQWANGLIGILMGAAAAVLGIIMIVRVILIEKKMED